MVDFVGGPSTSHIAIFIFTTGNAIWDPISAVLWVDGELDCLSYQCPLC